MEDRAKRNVLVVDDDVWWHDVFRRRFGESGKDQESPYEFNVDTASTLREGIERMRDRTQENPAYDVVVLDIRMPSIGAERGDGLQGADALGLSLQLREELPVIIIFTGYPTYASCVQAMRNGAWDYIVKEDVGERPAAQIVVDSAVARLRALDLRRMLEKQVGEWFPRNAGDLAEKYCGQIIALWHEPEVHVVASGGDPFELQENLREWREKHAVWEEPFILRILPETTKPQAEDDYGRQEPAL